MFRFRKIKMTHNVLEILWKPSIIGLGIFSSPKIWNEINGLFGFPIIQCYRLCF